MHTKRVRKTADETQTQAVIAKPTHPEARFDAFYTIVDYRQLSILSLALNVKGAFSHHR